MKKLPEFVYVTWNNSGNDGPWLDINQKAAAAIDDDGPTVVGTYQLVEANKLSKRVVSQRIKP